MHSRQIYRQCDVPWSLERRLPRRCVHNPDPSRATAHCCENALSHLGTSVEARKLSSFCTEVSVRRSCAFFLWRAEWVSGTWAVPLIASARPAARMRTGGAKGRIPLPRAAEAKSSSRDSWGARQPNAHVCTLNYTSVGGVPHSDVELRRTRR